MKISSKLNTLSKFNKRWLLVMKNGFIGICLIGAGRAGMIHAMNFRNNVPHAKIIAVADPVEEVAIKACRELGIDKYYLDYNQALENEDVDAVVIVSPTKYHCEITLAAAKHKKHILCEKPMAMDEEECKLMIEAAKENNVKLQIGFMRRFDTSFMAAKEVIDSGEIGEVVLVKSLTRGPSIPKPWMYDIQKSNGPLAEVNSHDIDTLRWFTGSEFKSVYAIAGNYRCDEARKEYPLFYDNVIMNAKFTNGMQGFIDGAQGVKYGYDARAEILCTKGIIYLGEMHENSMICSDESGKIFRTFMKSWKNLFEDAYLKEDIYFVKCIVEDSSPRISGFDGKMAVKVVNAGNLSIVENRIVNLNY